MHPVAAGMGRSSKLEIDTKKTGGAAKDPVADFSIFPGRAG
jgi:hypothetical protein